MTFDDYTKPFALVFDTETTGADPHEARLVTAYFAVVDHKGDPLISQEFLVNPGVEIPAEAVAVHGVSNEQAQQFGTQPRSVLGDIFAILVDTKPLPLLAYNAAYDMTLLLAEARRHVGAQSAQAFEDELRTRPVIDPYVLDKGLDKWRKGSRKLIETAAHYGVELSEEAAHGASADSLAAGKVALAILRKFPSYAPPQINWETLHEWTKNAKAEQASSFQAWLRTKAPADRRDPSAVISGDWPIQVQLPDRKEAA